MPAELDQCTLCKYGVNVMVITKKLENIESELHRVAELLEPYRASIRDGTIDDADLARVQEMISRYKKAELTWETAIDRLEHIMGF